MGEGDVATGGWNPPLRVMALGKAPLHPPKAEVVRQKPDRPESDLCHFQADSYPPGGVRPSPKYFSLR